MSLQLIFKILKILDLKWKGSIMFIDKTLLSKKSGQVSANELFGSLKGRLINAHKRV